MPSSGTAITVTAKGPVFQGQAPKMIEQATRAAVRELLDLGEGRLTSMLKPRPGGVYLGVAEAAKGKASIGNYRRMINARVEGQGARMDDAGAVYGPWLEGTGSRNATSRFEGYAMWRRTAQWLDRVKTRVVKAHMKQAVARING